MFSRPEIACVFKRAGISYDIVTGYLGHKSTWNEIEEWCDAARVAGAMRANRMGILGHYYGGMLDVYTDLTRQSATFGTHFEMVEMWNLKNTAKPLQQSKISQKIAEFHRVFDVVPECEPDEIERAAQTSVALDKLVESRKLEFSGILL